MRRSRLPYSFPSEDPVDTGPQSVIALAIFSICSKARKVLGPGRMSLSMRSAGSAVQFLGRPGALHPAQLGANFLGQRPTEGHVLGKSQTAL